MSRRTRQRGQRASRPETGEQACALYRAGRLRAAADHARRAVRTMPGDPLAWSVLSASLRGLGRLAEAVEAGQKAVAAAPESPDQRANLALVLAEAGRLADAEQQLTAALGRAGERPDLLRSLGQVRLAAGRAQAALAAFDAALEKTPGQPDGQFGRANALVDLGRLQAAAEAYRAAIDARPDSAAAYTNLGNVLHQLGRSEDAEPVCRRAVDLAPGSADAHNNLGTVRRAVGRLDAAADCFRRAAELDPQRGEPLVNLAGAKRFAPGDPDLALLEQRLKRTNPRHPARLQLHYALGKAHADLGDRPASAFEHFAAGARRKRAQLRYDCAADTAHFDALAQVRPPTRLDRPADGAWGPAPLFILGMPRSGTTLVEQMLGHHPRIAAGGEQTALGAAVQAVGRNATSLPELVGRLKPEQLAEIAREYYGRRAAPADPDAAFLSDKMPANVRLLAVIQAAFPDARIVHVRRHPLDTCLSAYTRLFSGDALPFSYDLTELGRYYAAYDRFMACWRAAVESGEILETHYESLVRAPECEVGRLLAHCGLAWDDACLAFHHSARSVRTASASQVRRPLYTSSIGVWRVYAEQLAPLRRVLEDAGVIDSDGTPRKADPPAGVDGV